MTPVARRRAVIGVALILVALVLGVVVTQFGTPRLDGRAVRHAAQWRDGWIGDVMVAASRVGYAAWLGPITIVAGLLVGLVLHRWRDGMLIAGATLVAALVNHLVKETFDRARPNEVAHELISGFSMPSGHAAASAAFATSVIIATHDTRLARVLRVLVVAFAVVVGVSRVVLGVHYPSDVLAGWALGTGVALLLAALLGSRRVVA